MTIEKRDFNAKTIALMTKLDEISGLIGDGNYLEMANLLKVLHDIDNLQEQVTQTSEYRRMVTRMTNPRKESKSKAEKMDSDEYEFCKGCDNWLAKSYMRTHKNTLICGRVTTTKSITHITKRKNTQVHKYGQIVAPIYRKKNRPTSMERIEFYLKPCDENGRAMGEIQIVDATRIFGNTTCTDYRYYVDEYRLPSHSAL